MYQHVSLLTYKQCFDEAKYKITLVTPNQDHRRTIIDSMVQLGFQHKKGRAPPNGLEDELSKWLQAVQECEIK